MKKIIAWLLVVALTAAISIGATLAYLTDTDEDVNVMTLGKVKIDQLEYERVDVESKDDDATVQDFHDNKPLLPAVTDKDFTYIPGDTYVDWDQIGKDGYTSEIWNPEKINNEVDKMVFIKNKGDYDAFVRSVFAFEAGKYTTLDQFKSMVHLNLNETDYTWEWVETPVTIGESTYFVATATYNKILAPGALTEISLSQIALDKTATNEDVEAFGDTYQILVKSQGIQADGFDTADFALDEGFGEISAANIPFESDAPTKGIDIITALNTYKGETITKKVQSIVFGKNADYPAIVAQNKGILMDVEQDVPANVYYVENNGLYQIYILSNDVIYAPTDCSNMCNGMSNLVSVDTSNLDVSRTTSMYRMFRDCGKLAEIDVSDWDTANVTNMRDLFRGCKSLPSVDVSNWKTGKVENMIATFQDCILMTEIDVSNWDTSNVTDMTQMFNRCNALKTLDVSNWNTGKVTSVYTMFQMCFNLEELDVANWDVSHVTTFSFMFRGTPNEGDMKLQSLDVSKWNPASAEAMLCMFQSCAQLTEMDMSGWNMPNLTNAGHLFADCFKLEQVDLSGWNTPALVSVDAMFNNCGALQTIDLSDLDTANVKEFSQMFEYCYALETVVGMDKWDTSGAYTFDEMFSCCSSLKELDLSAFNTANARDNYKDLNGSTSHAFETMFNQVTSLEKLIVSDQIVYLGNGNVSESRKLVFPNPATKEGYAAKWQNVNTKETYLAKDIPEGVAATYVPYYEYASQGATIKDALTYLNADSGSTNITSKIANVTFGLRKDYEAITSQYTGVLADAEQDEPVHAYYVENGAYYDLYFLSDGKIYTPKDSTYLFSGLPQLLTINTENLDVSRTEIMFTMFYNSPKLHTLDVSNWDTSNVTTMRAMFSQCTSLPYLDVSNWDVRNVQSTAKMFYNCLALHDLVGLGNWQTSSLTECNSMFSSGSSNTGNMPFDTQDLAVGNWDMSDVTNAGYMFYGCGSLEEIDLSNWDTSNMETFHHFFCDCYNLKKVNFSGWDTSKVTTYDAMFNHCISLEVLDLSSFDTSACTDMAQMFEICESLKTIYVGDGWDTSNIAYSSEIFSGCKTLVGGAGTAFVGSSLQYAHVDGGEENPGYLTYKAPETTNP